jgi:phosphatidylglycerol:prolipoprotein diacylglycerol transferase
VYRAAYLKRPEVLSKLEPLLTAYWPNNFMQAITDGPLLLGALCIAWWKPEKPGVVSAWFLIAYGVLRVGTEQLRAPDAEAFSIGPVTEPMLLSMAMIAAGAILLAAVSRSAAVPLGGIVRRS